MLKVEQELSYKIKRIVVSADEYYIPVIEIGNAIEILKNHHYAVFRIETFRIMNGVIKPMLSEIRDISATRDTFDSYLEKSLEDTRIYAQLIINSYRNTDEIYLNLLYDNLFD